MERPGWYTRIFEAVAADGRSDRAISMAANLGENYVHQLRKAKHSPKLDAAEKLARELNVSVIWILTGLDMDAQGEELVRLAASASPKRRASLISILREED